MALLSAGCGAPPKAPANPARITLENRSGTAVTGVLLRFDREIERADPVGERVFERLTLRLAPADTLRIEGGRLGAEQRVTFSVKGIDGPPRVVEGRWIIDGRWGPALTPEELGRE